MSTPVYIVDTFNSSVAKGSPTGVAVPTHDLSNDQMLNIARELNFAVTAFIYKTVAGNYFIQYFTHTTAIAACGHATLAAAKVIFEISNTATVNFTTIEKIVLEVCLQNGMVIMTYPKYNLETCTVSKQMLDSLNLQQYKSAGYCKELQTLFIQLEDTRALKKVQPDFIKLIASSNIIKEVVLTAVSDDSNFDYLLRSFCPWIGIDEDPVTGSVHTVLAGYWQQRTGKNSLKAYQASEAGGEIFVSAYNDKTELGGNAKIIKKIYF
jgi:PhzF family phenazine biosynthesis protein